VEHHSIITSRCSSSTGAKEKASIPPNRATSTAASDMKFYAKLNTKVNKSEVGRSNGGRKLGREHHSDPQKLLLSLSQEFVVFNFSLGGRVMIDTIRSVGENQAQRQDRTKLNKQAPLICSTVSLSKRSIYRILNTDHRPLIRAIGSTNVLAW
jgi:hypothetical protein